jgi:hypothetical protein
VRFLDPDAGEMLDRLSVLARKRLEKPERDHFLKEEEALLVHWGERGAILNREMLPKVLRLAAANMAIWECENQIRVERQRLLSSTATLSDLGRLAITLQSMNEERARLVQFFNEKLGYGAVEEKDFKL